MATSVHEDILDAVVEVIQDLAMTDLTDASRVQKAKIPVLPGIVPNPCVWVTPNGIKQTVPGGGFQKKDIAYPVAIFIQDRTLKPGEIGNDLYYRQTIQNAFESKRLSAVASTPYGIIDPQPILNPQLLQLKWQGQVITMQFIARELR